MQRQLAGRVVERVGRRSPSWRHSPTPGARSDQQHPCCGISCAMTVHGAVCRLHPVGDKATVESISNEAITITTYPHNQPTNQPTDYKNGISLFGLPQKSSKGGLKWGIVRGEGFIYIEIWRECFWKWENVVWKQYKNVYENENMWLEERDGVLSGYHCTNKQPVNQFEMQLCLPYPITWSPSLGCFFHKFFISSV